MQIVKFAKNQGVWQILAVWQVQESIADVVWPLVALVIPSFSSASGTVHCSKWLVALATSTSQGRSRFICTRPGAKRRRVLLVCSQALQCISVNLL